MRTFELAKKLGVKSPVLVDLAKKHKLTKNGKAISAQIGLTPDLENKLASILRDETNKVSPKLANEGLELISEASKNSKKDTPLLDEYTTDLTKDAGEDPEHYVAIGRDEEIREVIYNLNRLTKNNPVLIGEAGVGKTAIVEGLARLMALNEAGDKLKGKHLRVLQVAALGNNVVQKFLGIISELTNTNGKNILFIDEVHTIMGADTANNALDLGDVLKPAMARGDIQMIGSTTLDEYDKFIEKDPALERRFQQVLVSEPNKETALIILNGIKKHYEEYHSLKYTDAAITACVDLSVRYIADRHLPDKAIDLMDEAGSICSTRGQKIVDVKEIAEVLQKMTGIPVTTILTNDSDRLKRLRSKLAMQVKGQKRAIDEIVGAITIAKTGLQDPNKPLSSFLLLGTTGTGKTALVKALTEIMFDDKNNMIRFDMSEFSEKTSLDRFQYLLTDSIKRKPYCILLFDEIEKACGEVHDRLLQVLDDGELRDRRGRKSDFRNAIIIMTTNLGSELISDKQTFDGNDDGDIRKQLAFEKQVNYELTNIFRPEFINRIAHKVVFNMLTTDIIYEIAEKNLNNLNSLLSAKGFKLIYDQDLLTFLSDVGTDEDNGARPLARAIDQEITEPLSMIINDLQNNENNHIHTIKATVDGESSDYDPRGTRKVMFFGEKD